MRLDLFLLINIDWHLSHRKEENLHNTVPLKPSSWSWHSRISPSTRVCLVFFFECCWGQEESGGLHHFILFMPEVNHNQCCFNPKLLPELWLKEIQIIYYIQGPLQLPFDLLSTIFPKRGKLEIEWKLVCFEQWSFKKGVHPCLF